MKKNLVLTCASITVVMLGANFVQAAGGHTTVSSRSTSEMRSQEQANLAQEELTLLEIASLNDLALNKLIATAGQSPNVASRVLKASQKDDRVMRVLLNRLENDIHFRDQILITLLKNPAICDMIMNKYAQEYPKTASTVAAASTAS